MALTASMIDPKTMHAVRGFLAALESRYDFAGARLFGSRTQGTHTPTSDADVAVFLRGRRGDFIRTALAMADIAFDTILETGILVEPLPIWLDEWARPEVYGNPRLLQNIAREGVEL